MKTDWNKKSLSEVCQFINRGISPKYLDEGGIAVLNQKCVRNHEVNTELGRRHDVSAKKVSEDRLLRLGDVLVNSTGTGTLGRVAQLRLEPNEPTTVDSHVTIVRAQDGLFHPEFFGYALIAIENEIQAGGEGCGGQTELSRTKLAEGYKIGFPNSLSTQRRIVTLLDEAFADIATAKANAENCLKNSNDLFASCIQANLAEMGKNVENKSLDELCVIGDGNHSSNYPTKDELVEIGIPFIRCTNLIDGKISDVDMRFLSPEKHAQLKKGHLKTGDILVTNRGEIGRTAIVDEAHHGANLNSQIAWLRCKDGLNNKYLFHTLNSSEIQKHFESSKSGAALQQFTIKQLRALQIPLPSFEKQISIARTLDELGAESDHLESIYRQKLNSLDDLKKSLLHQAFSGHL